jgi:hypothetical protein
MSWWKSFFVTLGQGAATGFLNASQQPGISLSNAGIAAGITAATAALQLAVSHPAAQHPDVVAAIHTAAVYYVSTDGGRTFQAVQTVTPKAEPTTTTKTEPMTPAAADPVQ